MKKTIALLILSVAAVLCVGLGCDPNNPDGGINGHTHVYSMEIASDEYLCAEATCLHGTILDYLLRGKNGF